MKDWDVNSVRNIATAARDDAINIEKQAIVNCINEAARRGYYDYTMEIECYEVIKWLTDKGFTIIDNGSAKTISWAPITTAKLDQHPWA